MLSITAVNESAHSLSDYRADGRRRSGYHGGAVGRRAVLSGRAGRHPIIRHPILPHVIPIFMAMIGSHARAQIYSKKQVEGRIKSEGW